MRRELGSGNRVDEESRLLWHRSAEQETCTYRFYICMEDLSVEAVGGPVMPSDAGGLYFHGLCE